MLVSLLGWVHAAVSAIALPLALYMLLSRKGTPDHRMAGRAFVVIMLVVCVTSLGIYRLGRAGFAHWLAIATISFVALGWCAARFHWPTRAAWQHVHITAMLTACYLLFGGAINEAFLRIPYLHDMPRRPSALLMSHTALMLLFVTWAVWANGFLAGRRSKGIAA
jgi:uncharacterized membrane protein